MSKENKVLKVSFLSDACEKYRDTVISDIDEEQMLNDINNLIDKEAGKIADTNTNKNTPTQLKTGSQSNAQGVSKTIKPEQGASKTIKPKKRRYFSPMVAIAAGAAICALAVTGGMMNIIDPVSQSTAPSVHNSGQQDAAITKPDRVEEKVTTVTEKAVEKENKPQTPVTKGKIVLTGGAKKLNYTNPTKIELTKANIGNGSCTWQIQSYKNKNVLYSGNGTKITKELTSMISKKENGSYIVKYTYVDKNGNTINVHDVFVIETKVK